MTHPAVPLDGLPGTVTPVSLRVPPGLTPGQIERALRLIHRTHAACPWWAADLLCYAEDRLPEARFSQVAEALGWAPHTLSNLIWVARAIPASRRREDLSFAHHAEVARLSEADQQSWLAKAARGDGDGPWSSRRLRSEIRGLGDRDEGQACPTCGKKGYVPGP